MSTDSLGGIEFPYDESTGAAGSAHLGELLRALQAVRDGDFSVRLPGDRVGLEGKIADTFNEIVGSNERMADQLERVGEAVGREGRTRERVKFAHAIAAWGDMEASVNTLIDDLVWPTAEVTRAISAVAQGNLLQTVPLEVEGRPLQGEFLRSASIVNTMIHQLGIFTSEVTRVAREVGTDGKLGGQAQVREVSGVWKDLTENVNVMAANLTEQVRGTILRDAAFRPVSIAGMSMDITGRKRAEQERAGLLAQAQQAHRQADEANRLKDEFLATLSHELRTPLHAIIGWAHLLRIGALDPAQQVRAVETITRNAELQNQLIADILDVSRIVTGKLRLETRPTDLRAVLEAALDTVRPTAEARRIAVAAAFCEAPLVVGDPARLQQVVWNVLANAIKFAAPGGHVELEVADRGPRLEVTVRDDGPGIPPDFLPFIFDRFRQADSSSTRPHQGLGLGLAIVRHLVEMHGGTVAAANRGDRSGAVVTISLPRAAVPAAPQPVVEPAATDERWLQAAESVRGARVLVVDDEADGREAVAAVLERCGVETLVAGSAHEALGLIAAALPDLVLTDIEMPGEDGYCLLRSLRALTPAEGGNTRAAALTAYASPSDRERVLGAGFEMHVAKPIRPAELVAAVHALYSSARPERAAGAVEDSTLAAEPGDTAAPAAHR